MKLALGMMFCKGEINWMKLHLPEFTWCFDGIVAVTDDLSGDEPFYLTRHFSGHVYSHPFNSDWSEMLNHLIDHAESEGYDAIARIDPDEAIHVSDIAILRAELEMQDVLFLPRFNFWEDRYHYLPEWYPDFQARAFRLNKGIRYVGKRHEHLNTTAGAITSATLFHYGWIGPGVLRQDLKYLNYARIDAGLLPLAERPTDREYPQHSPVYFEGIQPLDPAIVGATAPWSV